MAKVVVCSAVLISCLVSRDGKEQHLPLLSSALRRLVSYSSKKLNCTSCSDLENISKLFESLPLQTNILMVKTEEKTSLIILSGHFRIPKEKKWKCAILMLILRYLGCKVI